MVFFLVKSQMDNPYRGDKIINLKAIDSFKEKLEVDDTFEVALFLDQGVKQNTMEGVIHFDPYTLELTSINEITYLQENLVIGQMIENEEGSASFDMASTNEFFDTNKPLITFTFKVIATDVAPCAEISVAEQTTLGYPSILKKEDLGSISVEFKQ